MADRARQARRVAFPLSSLVEGQAFAAEWAPGDSESCYLSLPEGTVVAGHDVGGRFVRLKSDDVRTGETGRVWALLGPAPVRIVRCEAKGSGFDAKTGARVRRSLVTRLDVAGLELAAGLGEDVGERAAGKPGASATASETAARKRAALLSIDDLYSELAPSADMTGGTL